MTTFAIGGQSSGDFKETSGRVQLLHVVTRNAVGLLTPDAFTQANPPIEVLGKSATLANITKVGVLGSTIAFTRPSASYGNGYHGGPIKIGGNFNMHVKPLGVFINDALGNAYENTPGVASGRGPYICGSGSTLALSLYETKQVTTTGGGAAGDPLAPAWEVGLPVYASINGLVTTRKQDAYEYQVGAGTETIIGIVKVVPDANSTLLVIDLRI